MNALTNTLVMNELEDAMKILEIPFTDLPDVKDKDGGSITDVKEKRLALVRQHVKTAGSILKLTLDVSQQAEFLVQQVIAQKYNSSLLKAQGQHVVDQNPPGGNCNCEFCTAQREQQGDINLFGAAAKRLEAEKNRN